jgi:hypothetical protein
MKVKELTKALDGIDPEMDIVLHSEVVLFS